MSRTGVLGLAVPLLLVVITGCRHVPEAQASPPELSDRRLEEIQEAAADVRMESPRSSPGGDRLAASTLLVQESAIHDRLPALRQRALRILLTAREADSSRRLIWEMHQQEGFVPPPGDGWSGLGEAVALGGLADLAARMAQVVSGDGLVASLLAHATDLACPAASSALLLLPGVSEEQALVSARQILGNVALSEPVRRIAARILGRLGDADDARRLVEVLDQGVVGNEAGWALRRFSAGRRRPLAVALLLGLDASAATVRYRSCQLIEELARDGLLGGDSRRARHSGPGSSGGGSRALLAEHLREVVVQERRAEVSVSAIRALGALGDLGPGAVSALKGVLARDDPAARLEAVRVLVAGGQEGVVDLLARLSRDEWEAIRVEAVRGLGLLGAGRYREVLERAVDDTSAMVRLEAARALVLVATPESLPVMLRGLRRGAGPQIKIVLADGLGRLRDNRATNPLVKLLGDQQAEVRIASARALGRIGGETASESLVYLLDDPDAEVRVAAARALAETDDQRVAGVLEELLDRSDVGQARISVALALIRLGRSLRAAPVVRGCMQSALEALEKGSISARKEAHDIVRAVAGHDFGYDPLAPAGERLNALREIQQWWAWEARRYR